jgi:putative transposase
MARIARFVVPGLPHHVTQRGNRRETVFFSDADYELYRDLLGQQCRKHGVAVWSYCLMPNHVHLILVPDRAEALGRALGDTHRRYSAVVNARLRVTGHLFQSRYGSVILDEDHLMAAARYVALNPVRARLVSRAQDWRWSSVRAHLDRRDDGLVSVAPLLDRCNGRFVDLIDSPAANELLTAARIRAYPAALADLTNELSLREQDQWRQAQIYAGDCGGTIDPCKRWPLATASGGLRR